MYATKPICLWIFSAMVVILLIGCVENADTRLSPSPSITGIPTVETKPDLEKYFQEFTGAFVFYDLNHDTYLRYNPKRCSERLLPASTFKIMNSLIGLETGVIPDENYMIEWDGTQHEIAAWNQDHTLKTAMKSSVVWYYQELARRVGSERMQQYIDAVGYGNRDISGPIDAFWLNGTLKISAEEQVEFLKRLYKDDLPFSQRTIRIVREILALEKTGLYQLSGKTGSGQLDGLYIGWFVGFLEKENNVYFFATNLESPGSDAKGLKAREITLSILQDLVVMP